MKPSMQLLLIGVLIVGCVALAAMSGAYPLSPRRLVAVLLNEDGVPDRERFMFWYIRLPRIASALLIGTALAGAGATYQGIFRNPLVSPDILGVSAGAGLGACIAISAGLSMGFIQLLAFSGGLIVVFGVWLISRLITRRDPVLSLVLIGVALGTLCAAGISLIKTLADPYTQLPSITFWLMGGLSGMTPTDLGFCAPVILMGSAPLLLLRWRMNLLTLSDEEALSLGINVSRLRFGLIVCATLVTASAVAVAGVIGWIGLIVPHIARLMTGVNYQRLLPVAMGCGAILLLLTDTLARTLTDVEIPLGIVTAFLGAPIFLLLLTRREHR